MRTIFKAALVCALSVLSTISFAADNAKPVTIGILVPFELPAMTQIVSGMEDTVKKDYKTAPVKFLVKNAQGDTNTQRAILQEFNSSNVNMVATIGTAASQMTIAMIRNKPIIGIAADNLKSEAAKANNLNVTGVNSHTPPKDRLRFMHSAMPNLKKITIVYSTDSHIFTQVNQLQAEAKQDHIIIQKLMITQLSDLYTVGKNIAPDSQAVFILKDLMVVSGLNTLLQQAALKHIPVIASDDGSVAKGAAFALGFSEYQTGVDAGKLAIQILNGKKASNMPVHMMKKYFVFLNPVACKKQNINPATIESLAKKLGYTVSIL